MANIHEESITLQVALRKAKVDQRDAWDRGDLAAAKEAVERQTAIEQCLDHLMSEGHDIQR